MKTDDGEARIKQRGETPFVDTSVRTIEDAVFTKEVDDLMTSGENARLAFMQKAQKRNFVSVSLSIAAICAAGLGFGWFFLMQGNLMKAIACVVLASAFPLFMNRWSQGPLQDYRVHYKTKFLPQMARLLGGLSFNPRRGISSKILPKTGIVPQHQHYRAEDCFMGTYKGIKIIFSEAKLLAADKPVFDGIFVLLELPQEHFEGHTIVTADENAVKKWRSTRWQKFSSVLIDNPDYVTRFQMFSSAPDKAREIASDVFFKELSELMAIFNNAQISAAFFAKKYVFVMIPCKANMFEPSSIHIPITTREHAMRCKHEIEQILSIIDILDLYKAETPKSPPA